MAGTNIFGNHRKGGIPEGGKSLTDLAIQAIGMAEIVLVGHILSHPHRCVTQVLLVLEGGQIVFGAFDVGQRNHLLRQRFGFGRISGADRRPAGQSDNEQGYDQEHGQERRTKLHGSLASQTCAHGHAPTGIPAGLRRIRASSARRTVSTSAGNSSGEFA